MKEQFPLLSTAVVMMPRVVLGSARQGASAGRAPARGRLPLFNRCAWKRRNRPCRRCTRRLEGRECARRRRAARRRAVRVAAARVDRASTPPTTASKIERARGRRRSPCPTTWTTASLSSPRPPGPSAPAVDHGFDDAAVPPRPWTSRRPRRIPARVPVLNAMSLSSAGRRTSSTLLLRRAPPAPLPPHRPDLAGGGPAHDARRKPTAHRGPHCEASERRASEKSWPVFLFR